jgi:hypothetical protein
LKTNCGKLLASPIRSCAIAYQPENGFMDWLKALPVSTLRVVAALAVTCVLASCGLGLSPAESASVIRHSHGQPGLPSTLSEKQLHDLSVWFENHRSGWTPSAVTYVPQTLIRVTHVGGQKSSVNIWSPKTVVVEYDEKQFTQDFEPAVVQELKSIAGASNG